MASGGECAAAFLPIVEPVYVPDVLITGRFIQDCGDFVRIVAYCDTPASDGEIERRIVSRWVIGRRDYTKFLREIAPLVAAAVGEGGVPNMSTAPRREQAAAH